MAEHDYDLIVIGAGPGGYVAAIRAAQLGLKTACVESRETLGGTCLNVGCIPSKALLHASEIFHEAQSGSLAKFGIDFTGVSLNLDQMHAEKAKAVGELTGGIEFLFKKNKVDWLKGRATFISANSVDVAGKSYTAKNIMVATGSSVTPLPGVEIDQKVIVDSTGALAFPKVPKHLIVIGGGVIGLELGSVYKRLGSEVTVVEFADSILSTMDASIGKEMQRVLRKIGMVFHLGTKVVGVERKGDLVTVQATDKKGNALKFEADYCLVAVGRRANTAGLNYEAAGLKADDRGRLEVNDHLQTSQAHIYAIGDLVRGAMLAHKAEEEGVVAAETIAGQKPHIDYNLIPGIVYTWPEAASVGKTEEELKASGLAYKVGNFPMRALGRSRASGDTDGFVKILADAGTDEVLGAHIVGARAADLIMELAVAMEFRASAEDIARICHGHPTYTEAIKEAALDATAKRALHM